MYLLIFLLQGEFLGTTKVAQHSLNVPQAIRVTGNASCNNFTFCSIYMLSFIIAILFLWENRL